LHFEETIGRFLLLTERKIVCGNVMTQAFGGTELLDEMMPPRNLWLDAWDRFQRNKMAVVGLAIAILTLFLGIFGPALAPYDYTLIE